MSVSHGILEPESPQRRGQLAPMLFLAVVAHALIILGIGFAVDPLDTPSREPLDVTWVTDPDAQAPEPEEVERIATEDQAASGEGEEVQEALSPEAETEGVGEPEPEGVEATLPDPGPLVMEPAQPEPEPEPEAVEAETDEAEPTAPEVAEPEPIESPEAEERPSAAALMNRAWTPRARPRPKSAESSPPAPPAPATSTASPRAARRRPRICRPGSTRSSAWAT